MKAISKLLAKVLNRQQEPPPDETHDHHLPQQVEQQAVENAAEPVYYDDKIVCGASQYQMGGISACTTMSIEAGLQLLHGCPYDVRSLVSIIKEGMDAHEELLGKDETHKSVDEIYKYPRYSLQLQKVQDIIGATKDTPMFGPPFSQLEAVCKVVQQEGDICCGVLTKQPETICLCFKQNHIVLFDSHSTTSNGAMFLIFSSFGNLCMYLKSRFPPIPDIEDVEQDIRYHQFDCSIFTSKPGVCSICIDDLDWKKVIRFPCGHYFCEKCVFQCAKNALPTICPSWPPCPQQIDWDIIQQYESLAILVHQAREIDTLNEQNARNQREIERLKQELANMDKRSS